MAGRKTAAAAKGAKLARSARAKGKSGVPGPGQLELVSVPPAARKGRPPPPVRSRRPAALPAPAEVEPSLPALAVDGGEAEAPAGEAPRPTRRRATAEQMA